MSVESTWYPGIIVVPVLVQLLRVEMRREVRAIGGGAGEVVGGGGVVGVVPVRVWQVVGGGRGAAVAGRHRGGGRDDAQGPVETWRMRWSAVSRQPGGTQTPRAGRA